MYITTVISSFINQERITKEESSNLISACDAYLLDLCENGSAKSQKPLDLYQK